MTSIQRPLIALGTCLLVSSLAACSSVTNQVSRADPSSGEADQAVEMREVTTPTGGLYCEARDTAPAIIETVTEYVQATPARYDSEGTLVRSPTYKTVTRQKIIRERQELWFKTPCAVQMTPAFISSVQRALNARGLYQGRDHGILDRQTRDAIRRLQSSNGLDSDVLSLETARNLGLMAYDYSRG